MSVFKKITLTVTLTVLLAFLGGWIYYNSLKPDYSGNILLKNLQNKTTTYFDDYGIPHIYAENEKDAYTTLGYVHAQDRLWQMELVRRITPGKLSEIFGMDALKTDKLFASIGIDEASEKAIGKLDTNGEPYKLTQAYLNGINQFIKNGPTPIEFTLIGIEKTPFTIKDVYNTVGYMAFSFAMAHKTDPLLTSIQQKLGNNYLKELNINVDANSTLIKNAHPNYAQISKEITTLLNKTPIPLFEGSNSWIVSGKKTKSGKVLFANDPHIGFSQPAVWFEAHISTPNYEMYGYHLAGVPFPLLGHNRNYAYGLTMFENDDIDFYQEENNPSNPNKYKTTKNFETYKTIRKTIKVKDAENEILDLKISKHGPIINNVIDGVSNTNPIAMFWVYTQLENKVLNALFEISHAKNKDEFKLGVSKIHAPGLNLMYADAKGNIAWYAAGKLYKHKPNVNSKLILDGASGENEIAEYLDFSKNPMAENPKWNYVYSANNQPDTIAGILYPGYYIPEDRAKRIVQLLEPKNNWTKEDFSEMINDVTSSVAPEIISELINTIQNSELNTDEKKVLEILKKWDGSNTIEQIAPTIYNKWTYLYLKNTFEDELGEELFTQFLQTHLSKRVIAEHLSKKESIWWDNSTTSDKKERKNNILLKSFKESVVILQNQLGKTFENWEWGKVHTLEHPHPLGTIEVLKPYFNVGPFKSKGAREVIDNRGYNLTETGIYNVTSGPSTRRIIDFSDIENSLSIIPTGQSGNPFSKHYKNQAEMFNKGKFRKMKLNKNEIIKVSTKLIATPNYE
ncbi:penicillin acylase family protein [Lutibacter sp. TH_r2]|uniref:penicillin acylase family protein n=1 Tax=Lutibacter sp. TH_r2 TaxID=3082083 RepID=UPI002953821D|nr:penicillin acylase family protein [Lutibacter sp. TH_r2]MDV7186951.1 penicillin acylase family protein [Lutibacter sp. TH_r2]